MKILVIWFSALVLMNPLMAKEEWVNHPLTRFEINQDNGRMKLFTPKYDYLVLDCMSFINEFSFYYNNALERKIIVDSFQCEALQEYLVEKMENESVCMRVDVINNRVLFNTDKCD